MSEQNQNQAPQREAYVEVDKNLAIETVVTEPDVRYHDVRRAPFTLYNFEEPANDTIFRRVPADVAEATNPGVVKLAQETAGGRVRFSTDSQYIAIRAEFAVVGRNSHMTLAQSAGFDLYEDTAADSRFIKAFLPPYKMEDGYEQIVRFGSRRMRHFTIHFPLHSRIRNLYVGLQEDATLGEELPYRNRKPIVIYGSSIVHGTGACRPGLCYSNILCRRLNMNVLNYGFSGNAKGEPAIANWLAEKEMSLFISDYDHNAPTPEHLAATHLPLYEAIRAKHPDIPYIMISKPNVATNITAANEQRKDIILDTYHHALAAGDRNVYYIDGESFFQGKYEYDCTLDGTHPNDLGYVLMADGIEDTIRLALTNAGWKDGD